MFPFNYCEITRENASYCPLNVSENQQFSHVNLLLLLSFYREQELLEFNLTINIKKKNGGRIVCPHSSMDFFCEKKTKRDGLKRRKILQLL